MGRRATTGIRERHARACPSRTGAACRCQPSFEAWAWSVRDRRKIRKTFPTIAAAKGWRADAVSGLRKGTLAAPSRVSLEKAATDWLDGAERGEILARTKRAYKPSTLRGYRHDLETHVLDDLGAVRVSEIRRRDLQALVDRLVGGGHSGSKVRNVLVPLQAVYRHAVTRDLVTIDPTDGLELPEAGKGRERAASPEEAALLLDNLPEADRALWATAFYAGLRRGELRALRCENLLRDDDGRIRRIAVAAGWDDVEGEIEPKSRKGARKVPVPETLRAILAAHLLRTGRSGRDFVFGRTRSEPFTPSHVRKRALRAWAAAAVGSFLSGQRLPIELEPIGLHEARHTYVSMMHAAGVSLEQIGDYVGHSSSYMTDRYRHLIEGHEDEAAAAQEAYLARWTGAQAGAQRPQMRMVER